MTEQQTGKLLKVVPERDGHRLELQWAVPPETKAYKVFPCSYLRYTAHSVYTAHIQDGAVREHVRMRCVMLRHVALSTADHLELRCQRMRLLI